MFHDLEIGSDKCEGALVRKNQTIKYTWGDILAFKVDEKKYGFARLIRKKELGYEAGPALAFGPQLLVYAHDATSFEDFLRYQSRAVPSA
ncbi:MULTISPECIES: hypothetical protein [Pseudomonas]|uniref:Uncharacterized protein n=1 Tax=Pseudomonas putida TaxID=303 RepID=A0A7Y7ZEY9_PSEPU|nr:MULTISPECIES: hypothetical protein [Pseudomonas]NWC83746.1 hypothetical protein [Pseudomonas putida]